MKQFHLGDILSVTTERLVSIRLVTGLHEILDFMTGDNLLTSQFSSVSQECKSYLLEQFPQLKDVTGDEITSENWKEWLDKQIMKFGLYLDVAPLPKVVHN